MSRRDKKKVNKARRTNAKAKAERTGSVREYLSFSSNEFDRIESMAAEVFLRDGHHTTIHMVFGKTGGMHLIADATSHGRAVDLVAKIARRHRVVAVVSIAEAWMATGKGNTPPTIPASQIPGRCEALVVAVESADASRSVIRRIKRNGNGVTLGERVDSMPNPWAGHLRDFFAGDAGLDKSDRE